MLLSFALGKKLDVTDSLKNGLLVSLSRFNLANDMPFKIIISGLGALESRSHFYELCI